jgi:glycyl-tRNA synthetase beta chain
MIKPLLIEIGTQELPAIPFLKELPNIEKKWLNVLQKYNLVSEYELYYTPRRIVLYHREFSAKQKDSTQEFFGAPIDIAYQDEKPTKAGLGFAKKCGVEMSEISSIKKGSKEVLYYKKEIEGEDVTKLLGSMVDEFVRSLKFGKSMRWEGRDDSFIRPIKSLVLLLGTECVEAELFGIKSQLASFVHRDYSYEKIKFDTISNYFELLSKNGVVLYQDKREELILKQFKTIENLHDVKIEIDRELLAEVVAITEYPNALIGKFDEEFLEVPSEVIVTSMKEHQRYFAVYKDNNLINNFIVVSNSIAKDGSKIIAGNEKVLRARLSDALFFWNNDLKRGLDNSGLENILFVKGLGTLIDKIEREKFIAKYLYNEYKNSLDFQLEELLEAVELSKADLMSEMVFEFTELQGIMGGYYAQKLGLSRNISLAISEQYLPRGESSQLPSTLFSAIVALSNKLDTLIGLFSLGMIPTGSKDPFALRRAVGGIIQIVLDNDISFDLKKIFLDLSKEYKKYDTNSLIQFFIDRFDKYFEANASVIKAVVSSSDLDIVTINNKIIALDTISKSDSWRDSTSVFKRVANITQDMDKDVKMIDKSLLESKEEIELYDEFIKITSQTYSSYELELDALMRLSAPLASFFDNVMVNVEDEVLKNNRKNLIYSIYKSFYNIADISIVST